MSIDTVVVEMLLVADDPRHGDAVTEAASLIAKVARVTASGPVDMCAIHSEPTAVLLRLSRPDFNTAIDGISKIVAGLRVTWGSSGRIIMENKRRSHLETIPITRHLVEIRPIPNRKRTSGRFEKEVKENRED